MQISSDSQAQHHTTTLKAEQGTIEYVNNYAPHTGVAWEVVNREKPFITLTIEQFNTEESYDVVYISDAFGLRYMLSGKQEAGRQLTIDSGEWWW